MARQHSPLQQVKEARQIAKDSNLILAEKKIGDQLVYFLYRITGGGNVFIGKRSSPSGIRHFVGKVAGIR